MGKEINIYQQRIRKNDKQSSNLILLDCSSILTNTKLYIFLHNHTTLALIILTLFNGFSVLSVFSLLISQTV
jgi:hypothetical protein